MSRFVLVSTYEIFETNADDALRDIYDEATQYGWDIDERDRSGTYSTLINNILSVNIRVNWEIQNEEHRTHIETEYSIDRHSAYLFLIPSIVLIVWMVIFWGISMTPTSGGLIFGAILLILCILILYLIFSVLRFPGVLSDREDTRKRVEFNSAVFVPVLVPALLMSLTIVSSILDSDINDSIFLENTYVVVLLTLFGALVGCGLFFWTVNRKKERKLFVDIGWLLSSSVEPDYRFRVARGILTSTKENAPYKLSEIVADSQLGINPKILERGDEITMEGSRKVFDTPVTHEWKIEPRESNTTRKTSIDGSNDPDWDEVIREGPPGVIVTESIYLQEGAKLPLILVPISLSLLLVQLPGTGIRISQLLPGMNQIPNMIFWIPPSVLLCVSLPTIFLYSRIFEPVLDPSIDTIYLERDRRSTSIPLGLSAALSSIGFLGIQWDLPWILWSSIGGLVILTLAVDWKFDLFATTYTRSQIVQQIPIIPAEYISLVVIIGLPGLIPELPIFELLSTNSSSFSVWRNVYVHVIFALFGFVMTVLIIFDRWNSEAKASSIFRFESRHYSSSALIRWVAFGLTLIMTLGTFLFLSHTVPAYYAMLLKRFNIGLATVVLCATFLPASYLVAGIGYQLISGVITVYTALTHSARSQIPGTEDIEPGICVYDGPPSDVVGYSDGIHGIIFIPKSCIEVLDTPEEIEAVLAHEEAHITEYNDSLWTTIAPFVSSVLLLGQNVLYTALDFRGREFRADQYAAEKTDPKTLELALRKLRKAEYEDELSTDDIAVTTSLTPFIPDDARGRHLHQRLFGTLYGSFAQSAAHPLLEERIDRLAELSDDT